MSEIQQKLGARVGEIHTCTYAAPFGVIPTELNEVYPLSQYEVATPLDAETVTYISKQVADYIAAMNYKKVILLKDAEAWERKIAIACRQACKKGGIPLMVVKARKPWGKGALSSLTITLKDALTREKT